METLLNVDQVTSDQNIRGLWKLYNDVEANTRSLKALGVEPETYGSMLASVLLGKLPNELRLIVSRKISNAKLTLSSLQRVMEEELTVRERTVNLREKVTTSSQGQPRHRNEKSPCATATTLLTGTQTGRTCCYCQQSHASSECTKVNEVQARREFLRLSGRCLRRGHIAGKCRSQNLCQHCRKKHHTSTCERMGTQKTQPTTATDPVSTTLSPDALPLSRLRLPCAPVR